MSTPVAVILVAGVGSRLGARARGLPKCLVSVAGEPILHRAVNLLAEHGVERLVLATGFGQEQIEQAMLDCRLPVAFCPNPAYASTQNAASLALCRDLVAGEAFFKLDGDVVFDGEILRRLEACGAPLAVAVDGSPGLDAEAMKVRVGPAGRIVAFGKSIEVAHAGGESIGIERISAATTKPLFTALRRAVRAGRHGLYYEDIYSELVHEGLAALAVDVADLMWAEIDTPEDLDRASSLVASRRSSSG